MIALTVQELDGMPALEAAATAGPDLRLDAEALAAGDPGALARLYDRCAAELYRLALWRSGRAADAADAVQDVFVRLARDPGRLARARDPRAYLLTMAHHAVVDRRRGRSETVDEPESLLESATPDPGRGVDAGRAAAAIASLPPAQRAAIYLHHFAGLTFRQIAQVTGVPTFTAASRYRLGLERLRRMFGVNP